MPGNKAYLIHLHDSNIAYAVLIQQEILQGAFFFLVQTKKYKDIFVYN